MEPNRLITVTVIFVATHFILKANGASTEADISYSTTENIPSTTPLALDSTPVNSESTANEQITTYAEATTSEETFSTNMVSSPENPFTTTATYISPFSPINDSPSQSQTTSSVETISTNVLSSYGSSETASTSTAHTNTDISTNSGSSTASTTPTNTENATTMKTTTGLTFTEVTDVTINSTLFPNTTTEATTTNEATIATDAPPNRPPKPEIKAYTVLTEISSGNYQNRLQFGCFFGEAESLEYSFYEIKWLRNGVLISTVTKAAENLQASRLSENDIGPLGFTLTCTVSPKYSADGNPGYSSESDGIFVGVNVNTAPLVISRSERLAKRISFILTVPFLCGPSENNNCSLQIQMYVKSDGYGCNGEITADENSPGCRKLISSSQWNTTQTISIRYKDRGTYYAWSTYTLRLVSYSTLHPLWNNFTFAEIQVTVYDDQNTWMGKRCYSHNDPHMKTFDGRSYENQNPGEYILYEHTDSNRPMQVQVKYYDCYGGIIFCNCGVAVRAGGDVYVIDLCGGKRIMEYVSCKDNILDVRRSKWNSRQYSIFFPTGTEVIVSIDYNNINVDIVASKHDVEKTRGLCGNLSLSCADDFILRNSGHSSVSGTTSCYGYRIYPIDFTSSWKENYASSLFNPAYVQSLSLWIDSARFCSCPSSESELHLDFGCSVGSVSTCDRDLRYQQVGLAFCQTTYNSTSLSNPEFMLTNSRRRRRSVLVNSDNNTVVPDDPVAHCGSTVGGTGAFQLCSNVPNVDTADSLEICALDIVLTNSTDWDAQTYESMKSNCLSELEKNTTLQEAAANGGPSVASIIENAVCPGLPECSNRGACINGTCVCSADYIDVDCSTQKYLPPNIFGVRGGGFCDKKEISCNTAFLVADRIATSGDLSCKVKPFTIAVDGTKRTHSEQVVDGKPETVVEVHCSVEETRNIVKRSTADTVVFIEGFDISVSYDRANFGEDNQMYIFDSTCQNRNVSADPPIFTLMAGTCFIDRQCYTEGTNNINDFNLLCNSSYPYQWTSNVTARDLGDSLSDSPSLIPCLIITASIAMAVISVC